MVLDSLNGVAVPERVCLLWRLRLQRRQFCGHVPFKAMPLCVDPTIIKLQF